ncbi:hypothetical protein, partial [Allosediminivita pacifica]
AELAAAHHGLLASKLAKKASTRHGAIQFLPFAADVQQVRRLQATQRELTWTENAQRPASWDSCSED